MIVDPTNTTIGDLCGQALKECGAVGVGQTPLNDDVTDAWTRMQFMLQQWERKRWLIYHLIEGSVVSTGQQSYTMGPGGEIDTGVGSVRPEKIEAAYVRQFPMQSVGAGALPPALLGATGSGIYAGSQPVDYPLEMLQSREDYSRLTLKFLRAGPGEALFYDSGWPLGTVYVYPIPIASVYEIHIVYREQLPPSFPDLASEINLPYEYYAAILYNLAVRLRPKYRLGTYPGDPLPGMAKDATSCLRNANAQIARLRMPGPLQWNRGRYNIFSDRTF